MHGSRRKFVFEFIFLGLERCGITYIHITNVYLQSPASSESSFFFKNDLYVYILEDNPRKMVVHLGLLVPATRSPPTSTLCRQREVLVIHFLDTAPGIHGRKAREINSPLQGPIGLARLGLPGILGR
eukprot:SAG22_NODE_862_length_6808_cov_3.881204_10_plen_127_part_00